MPYPNEHAARFRRPGDFDPDTFRRTEGGTIFGSMKVPKTISIIWGKLKGKSGASDPVVLQALRFPTDNWTEAEARKWLKDNDLKPIKFEPATGEKNMEQNDDSQFQSMPAENFILCEADPEVQVMFSDDEGQPRRVGIVANSGKPFSHGAWGTVILDMSSGTIGRQKKSILREHDPKAICGRTDRIRIEEDGRLVAEGYPTDATEVGRETMGLLAEGHPFEASVYVPARKVLKLSKGESLKVNGHNVRGPAFILKDWRLREVSLCALGADERTSAMAMAERETVRVKVSEVNGKEGTMEAEVKDEVQTVKIPEQTATVVKLQEEKFDPGAIQGERERCLAIMQKAEAFGLTKLGQDLIQAGAEVKDAIMALQEKKLEQLTSAAPVSPGPNEDPEEPKPVLLSEAEAQAKWNADSGLRRKFLNRFEVYYFSLQEKIRQAEEEDD